METDLNKRQTDIYVEMTSFLDGKGTESFMSRMKSILRTGAKLVDVDIENCKTPSDVVTKLKSQGKIKLREKEIDLSGLIKILEQMKEIEVKEKVVEVEKNLMDAGGATQTTTKAAPEGATGGAKEEEKPGTVNINQSNIDNRGGKIIGNMNITANKVKLKQ